MDVVEPIRRLAEASVGIPSREEAARLRPSVSPGTDEVS